MSPLARELLNLALIAAGAVSASFGIKGFLLSSGFIDGGVTGVSMLLAQTTGLPLAALLPTVNLPFLVIAFRQMGWPFALRSTVGIAGLAAAIAVIPYPEVTHDSVLSAVFGGFFLGAGIGLTVRGAAVLDGTEIAALLISRRAAALRVGDVILMFNVALFTVAMFVLGVERALYSILTYLAAARTVDFVLYGIDEYTAMTIVSERNAEIRARITRDLGRGVTIFKGYGGMSGAEQDIVYCVVTRLEIGKVKGIAREVDPAAFIVFHPLSGAEGGVVRTRAFH
jgi:uncharacterized membrane-anchored protein YitT (DUF2179 family)